MNLTSGQSRRRREKMGISRRPLLLGLAIVMGLGFVVYFRLWIIDYRISADDTELLRREFDLAHREAVDESAEWRSRFDEEMEKVAECMKELDEAHDIAAILCDVWNDRVEELIGLSASEKAVLRKVAVIKLKESRNKIAKDMPSVDERVERLQKENTDLRERLVSLKQELETVKLKCRSQ